MYQNLKKRTEGFTIIEVLIVLAIAGLIMLIVFLAVPALQRNSRNNARNNDASRISAAATECLSNRNNVATSCMSDAALNTGDRAQLIDPVTFAGFNVGSVSRANVWYGVKCNADNSAPTATNATTRDFAVLYQLEVGGNGTPIQRCLGSQ